jgi:hypothetical protein
MARSRGLGDVYKRQLLDFLKGLIGKVRFFHLTKLRKNSGQSLV